MALTKKEINRHEALCVAYDGESPPGAVLQLIAHIRERDAELTGKNGMLDEFDIELTSLRETVRFLNDHVREQDAALAEARDLIYRWLPLIDDCSECEADTGRAWLNKYGR